MPDPWDVGRQTPDYALPAGTVMCVRCMAYKATIAEWCPACYPGTAQRVSVPLELPPEAVEIGAGVFARNDGRSPLSRLMAVWLDENRWSS